MNNPFVGELIGTMLLIIFGDGVVANVVLSQTKGQNSGWIVIATGWATAVAVGVYAAGPISGAHINPAVTIGLAVIGKFPWASVVPYIIAQMIGAFLGAVIVWLAYRKHFEVTENADLKLAVFCTGPAINPARDLGPRLAHAVLPIPGKRDSDFAYGWIPVVGPIIGGIIGALLYAATFGSAAAPQ